MIFQSLLFTAVVTGLGQYVFAEERPYEGGDLRFFRMNGHGVSGHSSVAASIVRPLDSQYLCVHPEDSGAIVATKYAGKAALYASPVMVALSRVRSNRHYLWNVVLGLGVGYSVGEVVVDLHEKGKETGHAGESRWSVSPYPKGLSLSAAW